MLLKGRTFNSKINYLGRFKQIYTNPLPFGEIREGPMYIYNVTTNIEESAHDHWVEWMKDKHIPDMLDTGKFISAKMSKVLVEEDMGGVTYSVQYSVSDKETLYRYYQEDAPKLREEANTLFAGKFVSFRTELQITHEQTLQRPSATQYLFTYGTLQETEVQLGVFSRLLQGEEAILNGYIISNEKVADRYPTIAVSNDSSKTLTGKIYILSPEELIKADAYEGEAYKRIQVVLASGEKAWAYIAK